MLVSKRFENVVYDVEFSKVAEFYVEYCDDIVQTKLKITMDNWRLTHNMSLWSDEIVKVEENNARKAFIEIILSTSIPKFATFIHGYIKTLDNQKIISSYSSEQAVEDGVLFSVEKEDICFDESLKEKYKSCIFFITVGIKDIISKTESKTAESIIRKTIERLEVFDEEDVYSDRQVRKFNLNQYEILAIKDRNVVTIMLPEEY